MFSQLFLQSQMVTDISKWLNKLQEFEVSVDEDADITVKPEPEDSYIKIKQEPVTNNKNSQ